MALELKLRKLGNSVGLIFPKELLARLKASDGDVLLAAETENGVHLSLKNSEHDKTMKVFNDLSRRYRNTLRKVAR